MSPASDKKQFITIYSGCRSQIVPFNGEKDKIERSVTTPDRLDNFDLPDIPSDQKVVRKETDKIGKVITKKSLKAVNEYLIAAREGTVGFDYPWKAPFLFHRTFRKNLPSISKEGLIPRVGDTTEMTLGDAVIEELPLEITEEYWQLRETVGHDVADDFLDSTRETHPRAWLSAREVRCGVYAEYFPGAFSGNYGWDTIILIDNREISESEMCSWEVPITADPFVPECSVVFSTNVSPEKLYVVEMSKDGEKIVTIKPLHSSN